MGAFSRDDLLVYLQLLGAGLAAALWYLWPALGVWPLLIGLTPWVINLAVRGRPFVRTPFDWPILLFLLTAALAVWSAFDKDAAWAKFWLIVGGIFLFYAFANWILTLNIHKSSHRELPAWAIGLFGTAVAFYFIFTHDWDAYEVKFAGLAALGRALQAPAPDLPGHRLNPNVVGSMLIMTLPFALVTCLLAWQKQKWPVLAAGLFMSVSISLGLLLTTSRGAWLAVLAVGTAALVWQAACLISRKPGQSRWLLLALLGLGLLAALLLLALIPQLTERIFALFSAADTEQSRIELLRNSLILIQDYPFIGAGLGSYMMVYATYALLTHVGFIVNAHNLYLDVAVEQGLIGLAALVWMWLIFGWLLWREMGRGRIRPLFGAAVLSLLLMLSHGLVEDTYYGSRALLLILLPLAFVMILPQSEIARATSWRTVTPALGVGALLLLGLVVFRPIQAAAYANLGAVQQSRAELSVYSWPEWPIQDEVRRQIDLTQPRRTFEQALELDRLNPTANRRLGMLDLAMGQYPEALQKLAIAYQRAPWDNATRQLYGEALVVNGAVGDGAALWQTVDNKRNQLSVRVFWYQNINDADRAAWIHQAIGRGLQ